MIMKRFLLVVIATLCCHSFVNAQFSDNEIYLYVIKGSQYAQLSCYKFFGDYMNGVSSAPGKTSGSVGGEGFLQTLNRRKDDPRNSPAFYDSSMSTNNVVVYKKSYNGKYIYFEFSKDRRILNVRYSNGEPTQEYVRVHLDPNSPNGIDYKPENSYQGSSQNGNGYIGSGHYSNNYNDPNPGSRKNETRTRCLNCNNGRCVYESSVPYSGTQIRYSVCPECGLRYKSSHMTHRHGRCNTCKGTGYVN